MTNNKVVTAFIGLGSNLANPFKQIEKAIDALKSIDEIEVVQRSRMYLSKPAETDVYQPDYLNAVLKIKTSLPAEAVLDVCMSIEEKQGRIRTGEVNGPRIIDLDLLLFGDEVINTEKLIVPHPRMKKRGFVLAPLADVAPDIVFPDDGTRIIDHFVPENASSSYWGV